MARECVSAFLDTPFDPGDDGRHQRRVRRIHNLEDPPGAPE
jgi:ribose 5-phosphate isomerase RpiB